MTFEFPSIYAPSSEPLKTALLSLRRPETDRVPSQRFLAEEARQQPSQPEPPPFRWPRVFPGL